MASSVESSSSWIRHRMGRCLVVATQKLTRTSPCTLNQLASPNAMQTSSSTRPTCSRCSRSSHSQPVLLLRTWMVSRVVWKPWFRDMAATYSKTSIVNQERGYAYQEPFMLLCVTALKILSSSFSEPFAESSIPSCLTFTSVLNRLRSRWQTIISSLRQIKAWKRLMKWRHGWAYTRKTSPQWNHSSSRIKWGSDVCGN